MRRRRRREAGYRKRGGLVTAIRHDRCDAIGVMQNTAPGR
jgi:hypothetical protein